MCERCGAFESWRNRLSDRDFQTIIGRDDVLRQFAHQDRVIEIRVHVGQHRAARLQARDPVQRLAQREMRGMRRAAQRIDDPDIEVLQKRQAFLWQVVQVAGIGQPGDAEAIGCDAAVELPERQRLDAPAGAIDADGIAVIEAVLVEDRRIFAARGVSKQ